VGVLGYLDDAACEAAIENLAAMTATFLYLGVTTKKDREGSCGDRTDAAMLARTGAWYRKRLERHFVQLAFGLWMRRDVQSNLFELERGR
jgi:hypothetical protein